MKIVLCVWLALFFSSYGYGSVLEMQPSEKKIEDVAVAKSAAIQLGSEKASLALVGAGLRKKKVLFLKVDVYVAQLFVSDLATFKKDNALDSMEKQKVIVMQLHFLRSVDGKSIEKAFREGLEANGVALDDAAIKGFLENVKSSGEAEKGKTYILAGLKSGEKETLYFESTAGKLTEVSGTGIIKKVFSIWLGKTPEGAMEDLKQAFLQ